MVGLALMFDLVSALIGFVIGCFCILAWVFGHGGPAGGDDGRI
jgi:hypothetical protein